MKALKLFIFGFKAGQLLPPSTHTHTQNFSQLFVAERPTGMQMECG